MVDRSKIEAGSEIVVTDPNTGGQKASKLAQIGAIDPLAIYELSKVAGYGAEKYSAFNYAKGYDWRLSYDAMQRHAMEFWNGEDTDAESGLLHPAHAAWHGLTLCTFVLRGRGEDTRIHRFLEEQ